MQVVANLAMIGGLLMAHAAWCRIALVVLSGCLCLLASGCADTQRLLHNEEHSTLAVARVSSSGMTDSVGICLVCVQPGSFIMGAAPGEEQSSVLRQYEEQHEARILRGFYLGSTEVTNAQFAQFLSETGYSERQSTSGDLLNHLRHPEYRAFISPDNPVVFVSQRDAEAFCEWLSDKEGVIYRLPTEEEWEYACRAGRMEVWGTTSNPEDLLRYAWLQPNADGHPHPVATKQPNRWGFYDMTGNVWEWTSSLMTAAMVKDTPWKDQRVAHIRGGSYANRPPSAICAARWAGFPVSERLPTVGFRVLRERSASLDSH